MFSTTGNKDSCKEFEGGFTVNQVCPSLATPDSGLCFVICVLSVSLSISSEWDKFSGTIARGSVTTIVYML